MVEKRDLISEKRDMVNSMRAQLQLEAKKLYFPGMLGCLTTDSRWLHGFRICDYQVGTEDGQCCKGVMIIGKSKVQKRNGHLGGSVG